MRPPTVTKQILTRAGEFTYRDFPELHRKAVSQRLGQLWRSGYLYRVSPGLPGCKGKPAVYKLMR